MKPGLPVRAAEAEEEGAVVAASAVEGAEVEEAVVVVVVAEVVAVAGIATAGIVEAVAETAAGKRTKSLKFPLLIGESVMADSPFFFQFCSNFL
jgi:hypothetical protein